VRRRPSDDAPVLARLRYFSEDGPDEVYLVVRSRVDGQGRTWLRIRVAQRPRPLTGWVLRSALGGFVAVRTKLEVDRRTLRAQLLLGGRPIWSSRVGVGKRSTPTPRGRFWVRTRLRSLGSGGTYGPWAFGTSAYSVLSDWPGGGVIGIHGDEPAGADPRKAVARLRARAEREDPPARPLDADRHAGRDPLTSAPPRPLRLALDARLAHGRGGGGSTSAEVPPLAST
jgi:hypothetical protein